MQTSVETLETLGIDTTDIRQQVIERAACICADGISLGDSTLCERAERAAQDRIDELFKEHVAPKLDDLLLSLIFPTTNRYGEPKGEPLTFREMVVAKIEAYLNEPVDMDGRSKRQGGRFGKTQARLVHMVDCHFHHRINREIEAALKNVNSQLAGGIVETVRLKLEESLSKLKVETKL